MRPARFAVEELPEVFQLVEGPNFGQIGRLIDSDRVKNRDNFEENSEAYRNES